ncbi:hypothetical protein Pryu01_00043 [Paraliobacillus ryukyuensis]|uniref:Small basic protein n=1 Tax=Paraliobacillus ryukyuensis TaxID=200904 RepID=A0A366EKC6_9BACI|nr:DUF1290 domain-containing protein [Paraliobacillus ryukyuensis]RBP01885.1 small basic protein [Paraliobacillus ryukyuensis]
MWLPAIFLVIGITLGFLTDYTIPEPFAPYLAVTILASLDALFGGMRAYVEHTFKHALFLSGFLLNTFLAGILTFLGIQFGLDLYLAAVFAFGIRIFKNLSLIRDYLFTIKKQEK